MCIARLAAVAAASFGACLVEGAESAPGNHEAVQARFFVDHKAGKDANAGTSFDAPFRSIERARDAVRGINRNMTGHIVVTLRGGEYVLETPIELDERDSGSGGFDVIYTAEPGERLRLSGGRKVEGWKLFDRDRGIYAAKVGAGLETRQLFVNGRRAQRARSVQGLPGVKRLEGGYTSSDLAMSDWKNASDVELVFRAIWTSPRCGVEKIERRDADVLVTMKQPGFANARKKGITSVGDPWYIENAFELLDEPGEWYLDRSGAVSGEANTLYYMPLEWETLETASCIVPVLETLVRGHGTSLDRPVQNIRLHGIDFAHTTWLRPSSAYGVSDAQNNVMREQVSGGGEFVIEGAALSLRYARGIRVERCYFESLGGIGLFMSPGSQNNTVEGCRFVDVAANGIQIGNYTDFADPQSEGAGMPADVRLMVAGNRISNNYFNRCGVEYRSATAVAISYPRDTVIAHNEIYNMPYSGMHLGWGWNRLKECAQGNNLIEANRIQNTMVELADGGAIYTLGPSDANHPMTIIRRNYARQVRFGQGFYFDEESSRYVLTDNVAESIADYNVKLNGTPRQITVTQLYSNRDRSTVSKLAIDCTVEPAVIIDAQSERDAQRIKREAGLQPEFADIRPTYRGRVLHEAEEAELSGGAFSTSGLSPGRFGYSAMGFATNFGKSAGSSVTFRVNAAQAGTYRAAIRYAAPDGEVKGVRLQANEQPAAMLELTKTTGNASWNKVAGKVELSADWNTIALIAGEANPAGADIDRLELTPSAK